MFDTFANLLSSVPTFLFPVIASYKALKTSDPALLTPWLRYWVVLACVLLFESWVGFIVNWFPFYGWIRLTFLLYLILPQTQGAQILYQNHVHPFLQEHEIAIDDFISSAHERAVAAGLSYLKQAIELVKEVVLRMPHKEEAPPPPTTYASYTQSLIARFNLPAASTLPKNAVGGAASTANDFYALLAGAVSAATASSPSSTQPRDLSNSGVLIPPSVDGAERLSFIASQRERLSILLSALDREASNLQESSSTIKPSTPRAVPSMFFDGTATEDGHTERPKSAMSGLSTRKSELDFEKIEAESGTEDVEESRRQVKRSQSGGSWLPWSWGAKATTEEPVTTVMNEHTVGDASGKSSSVDA